MIRLATLALLAAVAMARAKVFVLDDANFDQTLKENSPMLVEFYAPWCGHCKSLEPEYEAAAKTLEEKGAKVFLGKVDATSEAASGLAKKFEIQGFPTLKFFPTGATEGQIVDYDGERKAQQIVNWLEKKTGAAFTAIKSVADYNKAKDSVTPDNERLVVVGAFNTKDEAFVFQDAAKKDFARDYYAIIGDVALTKQIDASATVPFIKVLRSFNISNPALTTDASIIGNIGKLEKFIAAASEPVSLVVSYQDNDIETTVKSGVHLVEFYAPWCGYCKKFAGPYEMVADHFLTKSTSPKVVVAKYDATVNEDLAGKEGIDSFPTLKIYKNGASAAYKGDYETDPVIKFVQEKLTAEAATIASESAADSFATSVPTALVGCVTAKNDDIMNTLAFQFASSQFKVGKVRCEEGKEKLTVYLNGKVSATYSDKPISDFPEVSKWAKRASLNPVFKFDDQVFDDILAAEYKYIVFYFDNNVNADDAPIKLFAELAAAEVHKDVAYSYAPAQDDYLLQYFNVKPEDLPAVRFLHVDGQMNAYVGPKEATKESIAKLLADFEQGSLEKIVQDEEGEGDGKDDYEEEEEGDENDADDEDEDDDEDEGEEETDEEEENDEL